MATYNAHILVDYNLSALCQACKALPGIEEIYCLTLSYPIHGSLDDLQNCSCHFCQWLWEAAQAQCTSVDLDRIRTQQAAIGLFVNIQRSSSNACLIKIHEHSDGGTIAQLHIYALPGIPVLTLIDIITISLLSIYISKLFEPIGLTMTDNGHRRPFFS